MTYFSYKEIFVGMLAFVLIGTITALSKINLQILFQSKQSAIGMIKRVYKNRNRLPHTEKGAFRFPERKKQGFFIDFFTVFILFLLYILVSYVFFDGICRIVYLLISYISYRGADAVFGNAIYGAALSVFNLIFTVIELFLSAFVFVLNHILHVILRPILLIIGYTKKSFVKIMEPGRKGAYLKAVNNDLVGAFAAIEG